MAKKFAYRGKSIDEIQALSLEDVSKLMNSRQRRSLMRGMTKQQKKLMEEVRKWKGKDVVIKTHARDMIIIPEMVGSKIGIYTGKEYKVVTIEDAMLGHYLGEFALTRKTVKHSAPGLGATRGSKFVPLK